MNTMVKSILIILIVPFCCFAEEAKKENEKPSGGGVVVDQPQWSSIETFEGARGETIRFNWLKRTQAIKETYFSYDEISTILDHVSSKKSFFEKKLEKVTEDFSSFDKKVETKLKEYSQEVATVTALGSFVEQDVKKVNAIIKNEYLQGKQEAKKKLLRLKNVLKNLSLRAKDIQNNVTTVKKIKNQLEKAKDTLQEQIEKMQEIEKSSWKEYQKFDELINDAQAEKIIATIKNNLENMQQIDAFLKNKFTAFFNESIQSITSGFDGILQRIDSFIAEAKTIDEAIKEGEGVIESEKKRIETEKLEEEKKEKEMIAARIALEKERAIRHKSFFVTLYESIRNYVSSFSQNGSVIKERAMEYIAKVITPLKAIWQRIVKREDQKKEAPKKEEKTEVSKKEETKEKPEEKKTSETTEAGKELAKENTSEKKETPKKEEKTEEVKKEETKEKPEEKKEPEKPEETFVATFEEKEDKEKKEKELSNTAQAENVIKPVVAEKKSEESTETTTGSNEGEITTSETLNASSYAENSNNTTSFDTAGNSFQQEFKNNEQPSVPTGTDQPSPFAGLTPSVEEMESNIMSSDNHDTTAGVSYHGPRRRATIRVGGK